MCLCFILAEGNDLVDLFDVSTRTLDECGHGINEEEERSDNGQGSSGNHQVQSLRIRRPVVP